MDLLAQFRTSVKNPFKISSVYVIFVTAFIILIVGLALLATINFFSQGTSLTNCSQPTARTFVDHVTATSDTIYKVNFSGDQDCYLQTWLTWSGKQDLSLWIYDPSGDITSLESSPGTSYLSFELANPLEKGIWKFVIKNTGSSRVNYKGEIGFR